MNCEIVGCMSGVTDAQQNAIISRIRRKLGASTVKVELKDEDIQTALCEAIEKYSGYINDWFLHNRLGEMLGLSSEIDFTLKYVSNSLYFEQSFSNHIAEQAGLGANSPRELKLGSIALTGGTQDYLIPAGREVNELLWYTPSFINLFGLDPHSNSNIAFSEFGASFAGHTLYHVMPVFDTILTAQAAELRNRVRGSEYSYSIHGGPDGQRKIRLYPIPTAHSGLQGATLGIGGGANTPGTLFYYYYDRNGLYGNPLFSGTSANPGYTATTEYGNGLVSSPGDASLRYISYAQMNSVGQSWVKEYAYALSASMLAMIRGKTTEISVPGKEITLNYDMLMSVYDKESERLLAKLEKDLELLSYQKIMENRAAVQESINKSLGFSPMGIYVY